MKFDRILEDSLGFTRRMLWAKSGKSKTVKQPFRSIRTVPGEQGIASLLEGRDTPRAVRTWMYSPRRRDLNAARMVTTSATMDLHLYCDFLGPLPNIKNAQTQEELEQIQIRRDRGKPVPTHRIQIFKASHFINPDGFYDCDLVFWKDCDFFVHRAFELNRLARITTDRLAKSCLKFGAPLEFKAEDWEPILAQVWEQVKQEALSKLTSV